ncbi:hypothetical protein HJC23_010477 [Cyclotella cryptica]|uniref:DNA repair and recombination protein RAD52 n=1 Tax=Cyclotella cryptica TaxID=29204 RepID=A0ABD3QBP6_9STRA
MQNTNVTHSLTNSSQYSSPPHPSTMTLIDTTNQPMLNYDGTEMRDGQSRLVYKSQFLSTHPLKGDCKERVGFGGKKFTYVSGDGVIRTMNAIFGHGGWSSQILSERLVQSEKDDRGRWNVGYLVTVRVTLLNGVSHEDCGSGEGINSSKIQAHDKALKSAVTDAMKRAARHFGERLGNALYIKGNGIKTAPRTNKDALVELERSDALNLFGDQASLRASCKTEPESPRAYEATYGHANEMPINMDRVETRNPTNQPPTPVASSAISGQNNTFKPVTTVPKNQYASNGSSTGGRTTMHASFMQGQHSTGTSDSRICHGNYALGSNSAQQHNPSMMPPPQQVYAGTRGISPETTAVSQGSVQNDDPKRSLATVSVDNIQMHNSANSDQDSNKKQKRNPYCNNRLSC